LWDFGSGLHSIGDSIHFCFANPGTYSITTTIEDINGCKSKNVAPFPITVFPRPQPDFSWDPEEPTLIENHVNFHSFFVNGPITSYHWEFGDGFDYPNDTSSLKNPSHEFSQPTTYPVTLIETNSYGCTDTITKNLIVSEDFTLYVPSAFSPNGDGINDVFQPKGMGFKTDSYELLVYDRWGNMVFKSNDFFKGWDGTVKGSAVANDVYVYKIKCLSTGRGIRKELAGHVTLIK
jgi:gliding motility-associated-like protein